MKSSRKTNKRQVVKSVLKLFEFLKHQMLINHISAYASSAAFYMFLSIIPLVILVVMILPFTGLQEADFLAFLYQLFPRSTQSFLADLVLQVYGKSFANFSFSAITILWASGKGMMALMDGLNVVHGVNETRQYFLVRLRACIYTLLLLFVVVVSLMLMVFGKRIEGVVVEQIPGVHYIVEFWINIRYPVFILIMILVFAGMYTLLPNKKLHFVNQLVGAVFVGVTWSILSFVFSVYVDQVFWISMYGTLSTLIILLIWLYLCMHLFLTGALINKQIKKMVDTVDRR